MKHYTIDGFEIQIKTPAQTTDVRFFTQKHLERMTTPEAKAELARRAAIVARLAA